MGHLLATLANGWAAFSVLSAIGGLGGLALIAAALVLGAYLPAALRHLLVGAGLAILVGAGLFQAGQLRGAHAQLALDASRAVAAERARADKAEAITRDLAAQATRDREAAQADALKLKELNDALEKDRRGARVCLPRDLARRLRDL